MAQPVQISTDETLKELGLLYMECRARAKREDQLIKMVQDLQARIPPPETDEVNDEAEQED